MMLDMPKVEIVHQIEAQDFCKDCSYENVPYLDLQMEALLQVSRGKRAAAEQLVEQLRAAQPSQPMADWQRPVPQSIEGFFDKLFISEVVKQPQTLSWIGLLESIGLKEHNAYLNDLSLATCKQQFEERKALFKLMQSYSPENLTEEEKITFAILKWKLEHDIAGEKFLFHDYRISQSFVGFLSDLLTTFTAHHKIEDRQDLDYYLLRLVQIPRQLAQTIEVMQFQEQQGIFPPRFAIEKVLSTLRHYFADDPSHNPLYLCLADKLSKVELDRKEEGLSLARQLIERIVAPSFRELHAYCQNLLETIPGDHGVWALPDGDAYYQHLLKSHTTTNLTADQIHELGLCEVARIETEMHQLLTQEGIADRSKGVGELMRSLAESPEFYYEDTREGREQCLADFYAILKRSREKLWPLFGITPKIPVAVLPVPQHEEAGMPAAYYHTPSLDGSREGVFYVNLRSMQQLCKLRMETLAIHEAEPGHHFQLSLQMQSPLHILRKLSFFTGYGEGWALYTEKLAYEQQFYSSPLQQLGHLQDELLRAVRLVVDTGIHKKRWSKEQAVQYMEQKLGSDRAGIVSEVERYFVAPGQACAYKVGQLKILALRQKARQALGERFDIRQFHDVILRGGCVPLDILEQIVDDYISQAHAALH